MWKHYFGEKANIYGVDIDPRCLVCEEERIKIFVGNQEDKNLWQYIRNTLGSVDILIDDGGHTMNQQITTFNETFFSLLSENGVYLCEDTHTSYWKEHGGGFRHKNSFIENTKDLIDQLNAWHSKDEESFNITNFTQSAYSIHYYDSIVVIEKRKMQKSYHKLIGKPSF